MSNLDEIENKEYCKKLKHKDRLKINNKNQLLQCDRCLNPIIDGSEYLIREVKDKSCVIKLCYCKKCFSEILSDKELEDLVKSKNPQNFNSLEIRSVNLTDVNEWEHRYERLEYLLTLAYQVCKYIDSTDNFGHWPDEIRDHVAQAKDAISKFNHQSSVV